MRTVNNMSPTLSRKKLPIVYCLLFIIIYKFLFLSTSRIKSEKLKVGVDFEFLGKKRTKIKRFLLKKGKRKERRL